MVTPDEWTVFKPTLKLGFSPIVGRRLGTKEVRLVYGDGSRTTRSEATPVEERRKFSLTDDEVLKLAKWACLIEASLFGTGRTSTANGHRVGQRRNHR